MERAERWRVIDTGLRTPAQNAALDRALLEAREADEIPGTLRFSRYSPSVLRSALRQGDLPLDEEACSARGVAIGTRLTDGGTFFCDQPHLAWALYFGKRDMDRRDGRTVLKRLCHAAAAGIAALGIAASYRGRNEIVADGRTIAVAGLVTADRAWLFQAVLALDLDVAARAALLRGPWSGKTWSELLGERVSSVRALLGRKPDIAALKANLVEACESEFGVELRDADLILTEQARYEAALHELEAGGTGVVLRMPDASFASAAIVRGGATLHACVLFEPARVVRHVWFSGCSLRPAALLPDLEAALRDAAIERVGEKVRAFFASRPFQLESFTADDFAAVVRRAVDMPLLPAKPDG